MARILEFLKILTFGLACSGIVCLIMMAIVHSHPPSALGSLTGVQALYYIMEGKGNLNPVAGACVVLACALAALCVSSVVSAISVLLFGTGQIRQTP